jgi:archaellum component FlaC
MKSFTYLNLIVFFVLFASCGSGGDADRDKLQQELDSLKRQNAMNEQITEEYLSDLNVISERLTDIKRQEGVVMEAAANPELTGNQRTRIENDLTILQQMLEDNKQKLADLNRRVRADGRELKALQALIDNLRLQLQDKDVEIQRLEGQLATLNIRVRDISRSLDSTREESQGKSEVIARQTEDLNRVYYAVGSFKELKDAGIIDAGGLFNARAGARLSQQLDQNYFTEADLRSLRQLRLGSKKPRIASTHPAGSYTMLPNDNRVVEFLEITDSQKFWSASKYLVVILD